MTGRGASAGSMKARKTGADDEPPKPAPAFSLPELDGKAHQIADLRGKVVMVFFWTTW